METIKRIIELHGGMVALAAEYIRLENPGYMRLVIEHVGIGPHNGDLVSVAHYYEQNGDAMRDPEIVFEVEPLWWTPVEYTQDNLGVYQRLLWNDPETKDVMCAPRALNSVKKFAKMWDTNLREQGFIKAMEQLVAARAGTMEVVNDRV
ncbi:hypothetical protein ANRL1_04559 [Anaerolineae bacterium]|nr:hypothetical protein ANRL1_04559 [Anaerolineae bacterium]